MRLLAALAVASVVAAPAKAQAPKRWTTANVVLASVSTGMLLVDWGQTLTTARHPDVFYENNPLLPKLPSVGRVNTYFVAAIAGNLLLAHVLPNPWRNISLAVVTAVEVKAIARNTSIGLGVSLPW